MAGIGFELKRIFKVNSVIAKLQGSGYATLTTIGPLIMVITTLFLMYALLGYNNVVFASKELLANTILYIFIFSLCTSAPFNSVLSRYIADKLFENEEDDIMPAYYSILGVNIVFSAIFGIAFCLWLLFVGKVGVFYILCAYLAYLALVFVFYNMLFISALKEYKKIAFAFVIGMLTALILGVVLVKLFGVRIELAVVIAFGVGFILIGSILFGLIRTYFKTNSGRYGIIFRYFQKHWRLVFVNTFYILGLYVHNFIFWTSNLRVVFVDSFVSAPIYDMATCIAMFINISTTVIFIVEVETNFHDKYKIYCEQVLGGTGEDIRYAKAAMFREIQSELFFIIKLQAVFSISIFLVAILVLPLIGIGGMIMTILPSLAVAYFVIFLMYALIIFMYYFNVYNQALITSAIFFGVTIIASLFAKTLAPSLYGIGILIGAFAGFAYGFYALRSVGKNLEYYIFCKGKITPVTIDKKWGQTIYENKRI